MKRSWEKPELIVLMKRKSDETILMGCKEGSITNMNSTKGGCLPYTYILPAGGQVCSGDKCKQ